MESRSRLLEHSYMFHKDEVLIILFNTVAILLSTRERVMKHRKGH